jgi:hypothetical protein
MDFLQACKQQINKVEKHKIKSLDGAEMYFRKATAKALKTFKKLEDMNASGEFDPNVFAEVIIVSATDAMGNLQYKDEHIEQLVDSMTIPVMTEVFEIITKINGLTGDSDIKK